MSTLLSKGQFIFKQKNDIICGLMNFWWNRKKGNLELLIADLLLSAYFENFYTDQRDNCS